MTQWNEEALAKREGTLFEFVLLDVFKWMGFGLLITTIVSALV